MDDQRYSATCYIDKTKLVEEDFQFVTIDKNTYKIKAKDGKFLALPQDECFIVRNKNADTDEFQKLPQWLEPRLVTCKLGDIQFASSPFYVISDQPHFYKTMRVKDGAIFYYPRYNCSIRIPTN